MDQQQQQQSEQQMRNVFEEEAALPSEGEASKPRVVVVGKSANSLLRNLLGPTTTLPSLTPGSQTHTSGSATSMDAGHLSVNVPRLHKEAQRVWHDATTGAAIYLGPRASALVPLAQLRSQHVVGVVNCTNGVPCVYRNKAENNPGLAYCQVAVNDTEAADIHSYLPGATVFMNSHLSTSTVDQPRSVLVHCEAGVSRSATVVLAYLVRYQGMSLADALDHVYQRRPIVQPNGGFCHQLELFARQYGRADATGAGATGTTHRALSSNSGGTEPSKTALKSGSTLLPLPTAAPELDAEWVRASTAVYATCRDMLQGQGDVEGGKSRLHHGCFDALRQRPHMDRAQFLFVALDYLWGRGVLAVEADWLAQACRVLDETSAAPPPLPAAQVVDRLLTDQQSSPFCEQWEG